MYLFTVRNKAGGSSRIAASNEERAKELAAASGHVRTKENAKIARVQLLEGVEHEGWTHIHHTGGKPDVATFVVIDQNREKHNYPAAEYLSEIDW